MSDYYFYRYHFNKVPAEVLIGQEKEAGTPMEMLNRRLSSRQMPVMHSRKNGDVDTYNNVIYFQDGVALMQLQNNTSVTIHKEDFSFESEPSFPFVDVIIDNRDGHHLIAIEKNSSFKKSKGDHNPTQRVARIMAESINEFLRVNGNEIVITPITRNDGLYPTMVNRIRKQKARVKSVTYRFPTDDEDSYKEQLKGSLAIITQLTRHSGGNSGGWFINFPHGDEEDIKHVEEDFKVMELFIGRQHYEVDVRFDDMSILRSGDLQWAHYELLERDIADFIGGFPTVGEGGHGKFQLNIFLDKICKTLDDYEKK